MTDLTDDDRKFAEAWAYANGVTVTNHMPEWVMGNRPIWLDCERFHVTDSSAWSALAAALAPIRRSFEQVMTAGLREEIELLRQACGLKEGEKLIKVIENDDEWQFIAETRMGQRQRIGLMKKEYDELINLWQRLAELEAAGAWRPIDEQTPKGQDVMLRSTDKPIIGDWKNFCIYNAPEFTHWQPLPAPPPRTP